MAKYRVRDGVRHGSANQHGPGAIVELDEQDAFAFRDKLEMVVEKPKRQTRRKKSPPKPAEAEK